MGLEKYGFELIYPEISISHIFPNDHGCVSLYKLTDKTIKSIQKFSAKDARTWNKMFDEYKLNRDLIISSLNSPPAVPIQYAKAISSNNELTESKIALAGDEFRRRSQSMRSWCDEHFESDEIKAMFGTFVSICRPFSRGCRWRRSVLLDWSNNPRWW